MKNSIIYTVIGIFAIIMIGVGEEIYLKKLSDELTENLTKIEDLCQNIGVRESMTEMNNLMEKWEKQKKILGALIDHQDVHKIEAGLIEISEKIKNNFEIEQISANFSLSKLYIESISEENKFTIVNIL